jgi:energy-coupling factor transport system substrate-specific component
MRRKEMNQQAIVQNKGLSVKDLVTTGIFSALFFVATMIGGILFAANPILTFMTPVAIALVAGPVYMLLTAKVPKRGPILILGVIMAVLMFVTGMYWLWSVAYIVLAVAAELIAGSGHYRNMKRNIIGYIIFSLNPIASYMMLWINQQAYTNYLMSKGTEQAYMDTMMSSAQSWMLPAMILVTALFALLGAVIV